MATRPASAGGDGVACAVACPELAERLRARFGGGVSVRAPGDPVAAIALCGVESFVGRRPRRGTGRDLTVVVARAPGETLEAALLAGGADDVIDEDRSDALILARLHALARRHRRSHAARVACGPWLIDFEGEEARADDDGRHVRLTRLEARLLRFLADREGAPVPPHVLLARVFGYNDRVETHTLETHVYRLRRKLEEEPGRPRLLLRGTDGYRLALEPPVREAGQGGVTTATEQPASAPSITMRDPCGDKGVRASPRQACTRP